MGLFSKIKEGLFKTRGSVGQKMDQLVENSRALDDDFYDELSDILVMADVGVTTATEAVDELRERVTAEKITDAAKAKEIFKEILAARMRDKPMVLESPSVIFIIGVNGVGKTTSIGKLASRLKTVGRRVLIVAGDTFRAAAAEQLTVWADRADVPIVRRAEGADPASVVFDGIQTARARHADVLLVDTAGRLHNKAHLMEELKKMARIVARDFPEAKMHALLVIDATTGQNAIAQAKVFAQTVDITGIVLTKLDGTAKGGVAVAIKEELGVPVRFVGVGEGIDDLQPFDPEDFAKALF